MITFKPKNKRYIVREVKETKKQDSVVLVPVGALTKKEDERMLCRVLSRAPDCEQTIGVGDYVVVEKHAVDKLSVSGTNALTVREQYVVCVVSGVEESE